MTITVTTEDIAKGDPGNCSTCPVALAIARETGFDASYIDVEQNEIVLGEKSYPTPPNAERFIECFDNGNPVQPFTFDLPI